MKRRRDETLHQFARRIKSTAPDDEAMLRAAGWYVEYAATRYNFASLLDTDARPAPPALP